ncbi:MAG: tRNA preQ1(34) S-adenosylmethionine ribosyltransferase-isomerase QueA [Candidatus Cybelea sp.]
MAQQPALRRDESRLLVLDDDGTHDRVFRDLPKLLRTDDLLVLNETRVIAARLFGEHTRGPARVELLLLHPAGSLRYDREALTWIALARPARRLREGDHVCFGEFGEARVTKLLPDGMREIEFSLALPLEAFLDRAGKMPLPPYIHNETAEAAQRYQTVFARVPGSVAAPTASLHFSPELLLEIQENGIEIARLTLDVGLGTFRPVTAERLDEHVMHAEAYAIDEQAAAAIEAARVARRRIVAVGTTVVRALEGNFQRYGCVKPGEHVTDIFIRPGFRFEVAGAMVTNFHLPRSTLLALVSAFAGRERVLHAYREAIARGYRFYSFGDAMFLARSP